MVFKFSSNKYTKIFIKNKFIEKLFDHHQYKHIYFHSVTKYTLDFYQQFFFPGDLYYDNFLQYLPSLLWVSKYL